MDTPKWSDIYTCDELAAALRHHAAVMAKNHGAYSVADELRHAAECIDDLADRIDDAEMQRAVRCSIESLGKVPPQ